ncbi:hypothetical protein EDC01DRAFT_637032 [Geopyxis carbonaria]|nr:hypothetical protein EDC01DRAFT_637032 [Geopyxis carbonaria]
MMGEQKHRVFKSHAKNTNQRENELQLLKEMNTLQVIRLLMEDTFATTHPTLTSIMAEFVHHCPTIKIRLLGHNNAIEDGTSHDSEQYSVKITTQSSHISSLRAVSRVANRSIGSLVMENDNELLRQALKRIYQEEMLNVRAYKIRYWRLASSNIVGSHERYRLTNNNIRSFAYIKETHKLVYVKRIITVTMGMISRIFLCIQYTEELYQINHRAPYQAYIICNEKSGYATDIIAFDEIIPVHIHMIVANSCNHTVEHDKADTVYMLNEFVPKFI